METRHCSRCKHTKPLYEFKPSRGNTDKLTKSCVPCRKYMRTKNKDRLTKEQKSEYNRQYRLKNKDKIREKTKLTDRREYMRRYYKKRVMETKQRRE